MNNLLLNCHSLHGLRSDKEQSLLVVEDETDSYAEEKHLLFKSAVIHISSLRHFVKELPYSGKFSRT